MTALTRGRLRWVAVLTVVILGVVPWLRGQEQTPETAALKHADEAQGFFGLDRVWTMRLTVESNHWAAMEPISPAGPGPRGPGRLERDYPEVPAQFEWEGRRWTNIALRYKGNSSFNFARDSLKRSLKLDFNDLTKGQRFLGLTKLNLNNNTMDATQMQEALAYDLFRRAGVPAPRTAFVRLYLTIPGAFERRYVGLYTAVEQVDERFLEKRLGTAAGLLLKPETAPGIPYFGNAWKAYKAGYDPKSKASMEEKNRLMAFARLVQQADGPVFDKEIGSYLEVEAFLRFLAVNVVLANYDSCLAIGHNYYLHLDPRSNRFRFVPWDVNHAFGKFPMTGPPADQMQGRFLPPNLSPNPLIEKIMANPDYAAAYRRHVQQVLEQHFQPERLHAQIDAIAERIRPALPGDLLYAPAEFERAVSGAEASGGARGEASEEPRRRGRGGPFARDRGPSLKDWINGRAASLQAQLSGQSPGTPLSFNRGRPGGPGGRDGRPDRPLAEALALRSHQAADADQDRNVSRSELLEFLAQGFPKTDRDGNGQIDEAELREFLNTSLPAPPGIGRQEGPLGAGPTPERPAGRAEGPGRMLAPRLLRAFDLDGNGSVTLAEARQVAADQFARQDGKGDGLLDLEEWTRWWETLLGPPPRRF